MTSSFGLLIGFGQMEPGGGGGRGESGRWGGYVPGGGKISEGYEERGGGLPALSLWGGGVAPSPPLFDAQKNSLGWGGYVLGGGGGGEIGEAAGEEVVAELEDLARPQPRELLRGEGGGGGGRMAARDWGPGEDGVRRPVVEAERLRGLSHVSKERVPEGGRTEDDPRDGTVPIPPPPNPHRSGRRALWDRSAKAKWSSLNADQQESFKSRIKLRP